MRRFRTSNTAKRAALGVALLGVVGVLASLALASAGPPAPRITSGPARQTRTRTATFSFNARQPGVRFECSLDGSRYATCRSPRTYGVQWPGRHIFRVRARSASGAVGSPASYTWTIDLKAPKLAVSFAASNGSYGSARWNAGCAPHGAGVCGTVAAPAGVKSVIVWIKQNGSGRWWNGRAFTARQAVWLTAALIPKPTMASRVLLATWIYRLALPQPSGSYTMLVRGSDQIGNLNRLKTQKRVSFTINADRVPTDSGGTPFTISGDAAGALYPGAAGEHIPLTFHNPNPVTIYVTGVTVALESSSVPTGCRPSSYVVTQATIPAGGVAVPANGTISLPAQGATAPSIQMIDTGSNQNACQGAKLRLAYSGSAHS